MYLHVFLPVQEQGLLSITSLSDGDGKIACSVVSPENFRDHCPANSLKYYKKRDKRQYKEEM